MVPKNLNVLDCTLRSKKTHQIIYGSNCNDNMQKSLRVYRKSEGNEDQIASIRWFVQQNNLGSINGLVECDKEWIEPPLKIITHEDHRIGALIGQKGVIATQKIANNTCLSQYSGVEYTNGEWDTIYYGSNKYLQHRPYLCGYKRLKNKITIDAMELSSAQKVIYINDYRHNIYQTNFEHTKWDEHFQNTNFCEVNINKCPAVFVVTNREIAVGEEIFIFYGSKYGEILNNIKCEQEIQRYKKCKFQCIFGDNCLWI